MTTKPTGKPPKRTTNEVCADYVRLYRTSKVVEDQKSQGRKDVLERLRVGDVVEVEISIDRKPTSFLVEVSSQERLTLSDDQNYEELRSYLIKKLGKNVVNRELMAYRLDGEKVKGLMKVDHEVNTFVREHIMTVTPMVVVKEGGKRKA